MKIKIHVKGIVGSQQIVEGQDAGALYGGILEIDGHVIEEVTECTTRFINGFVTVNAEFLPSSLEVVTHTVDSWQELTGRSDEGRDTTTVKNIEGKAMARH